MLWISLLIEFSSKTDKRNITTGKTELIRYLCFVSVDFIRSCHHRLKKSNFILEKKRLRSIDLTRWDQLTTAFTILNFLEYEFSIGFLVQGRQQSLGTFSTRVFSGNLKRQTGRGHVIKLWGDVRSSQHAFFVMFITAVCLLLLPRGRFSCKWFTWTFYILNLFICQVQIRKLCKPVFLEQV